MTAIADMGALFFAPTPLPVRQYLRQALAGALDHYDRLVLPVAGRLQLAEAAVDAGWRVGEIQCADVNLFAVLLGTLAAEQDVDALGIDFPMDNPESDWARQKRDEGHLVAAVGMMLKWHSFNPKVTMDRMVRAELFRDRDRYGHQLQARVLRLVEKLRGLDFRMADAFQMVGEAVADERAVIALSSSRTIGQPFACVGERGNNQAAVTWNAPMLAPFEPKAAMDKLHHDLMPANALALLHWPVSIPAEYRERSVFAMEVGAEVREHILCNRPDEARTYVKVRQETDIKPDTRPVCGPDTVVNPPDSVVTVAATSREVALYYLDLWGGSRTSRLGSPYLILLDGAILGVAGLSFSDIRKSMGPWVSLPTLACAPGVRGADVLCMLALTCEDSRKLFDAHADAPLYDVADLRVTLTAPDMISWPCAASELMLQNRHRRDDGRYDLTYQGPFRVSTFLEVADEFLALPQDGGEHARAAVRDQAPFPHIIFQHGPSSDFRLTAHRDFDGAKRGDPLPADRVVAAAVNEPGLSRLRALIGARHPWLVPVRSANALPVAYAARLARSLDLIVDVDIRITGAAGRTGQDAVYRLLHRPEFSGAVEAGRDYLLVDDMVTQGGTLAELRSYILAQGGRVIGATALAGAKYAHLLSPRSNVLAYVREKFQGVDEWWRDTFGYELSHLTDSEAYAIGRFASFEALQARVLQESDKIVRRARAGWQAEGEQ